jgi:hypothetical protein
MALFRAGAAGPGVRCSVTCFRYRRCVRHRRCFRRGCCSRHGRWLGGFAGSGSGIWHDPIKGFEDSAACRPDPDNGFAPCHGSGHSARQDGQRQRPCRDQAGGTRGRPGRLGCEPVHRGYRWQGRDGRSDRSVWLCVLRSGNRRRLGNRRGWLWLLKCHPLIATARAAHALLRRQAGGGDLVLGGTAWAGDSHSDPL